MNEKKINLVVYGPGCMKCLKLEEHAKKAVESLGLSSDNYTLRKVSDFDEFVAAGITMTPALSINGELVFHGRVGTTKAIVKHIEQLLE